MLIPIFFILRKECPIPTVVDMSHQCSERNLRLSKSNHRKNHVQYTWLSRHAKDGCSRIWLSQKLNDLIVENLFVIKPIYFRYFCDPLPFYLSTSQNLINLVSTQIWDISVTFTQHCMQRRSYLCTHISVAVWFQSPEPWLLDWLQLLIFPTINWQPHIQLFTSDFGTH